MHSYLKDWYIKTTICVLSGRTLRGKAFYNVHGKVYCEEDYLVRNNVLEYRTEISENLTGARKCHVNIHHPHPHANRPLHNSVVKNNDLISEICSVLKELSQREHPKHMFKLMDTKIVKILHTNKLHILIYSKMTLEW